MEPKEKRHILLAIAITLAVAWLMARACNPAPPPPQTKALNVNYRPVVCDDAWEAPSVDMREFGGGSFVVKLHENGFHEAVLLPKDWHKWRFDINGPESGNACWYAVWPSGGNPTGPIQAGKPFDVGATTGMRLQGMEGCTLRFFNAEWKP